MRQEFIQCAESYLGAKQGSAKHREIVDLYNTYLPHPRGHEATMTDPWCAIFVSAMAIKSGVDIPIECSCGEQVRLLKERGMWRERGYKPSPADLIYYDWNSDGLPNHVGIVVDDCLAIEGNKGGMVAHRRINFNAATVRGFGVFPEELCEVSLPVLQKGAKGNAVKSLQLLLNLRGHGLALDGSFGPATEKAVKAFQQAEKIDVDGSVGPVTWNKIIV